MSDVLVDDLVDPTQIGLKENARRMLGSSLEVKESEMGDLIKSLELANKGKLGRNDKIDKIFGYVMGADEDKIGEFVEEFNQDVSGKQGILEGCELGVVPIEADGLLFVNEEKKLEYFRIEDEKGDEKIVLGEARKYLKRIKGVDLKIWENGSNEEMTAGYELRKQLLRWGLKTAEVFTVDPEFDVSVRMVDYDSEAWIPEEQKIHQEIADSQLEEIRELSDKLKKNRGQTVVVLRGNSGSGKSAGVHEFYPEVVGMEGRLTGTVAPDVSKMLLKQKTGGEVGLQQTHKESVALGRKIVNQAVREEKLSIVLDKRNMLPQDLEIALGLAEINGGKVEFMDNEARAIICCVNQFLRMNHESSDPPQGFMAVAVGAEDAVKYRRGLIEEVQRNDKIGRYRLVGRNQEGLQVIAEKVDGEWLVHDQQAYEEALDFERVEMELDLLQGKEVAEEVPEELQLLKLAKGRITQEVIEYVVGLYPERLKMKVGQALNAYKGKMWVDAMNEHAKKG